MQTEERTNKKLKEIIAKHLESKGEIRELSNNI